MSEESGQTEHNVPATDADGRLRPGAPGPASRAMLEARLTRGQSGYGLVEVQRVDGRSAVTRQRATDPLKLLCPTRSGDAAWIYTSTYGGGLVAGDEVDLSVDVRAGAMAVLSTQASTKVYRRDGARGAVQRVYGHIEPGATLAVMPDPLTCFADADYDQRQRFDLVGDGALVLLDWFTSGRRAHGERWAFHRYASRLELCIDEQCVLRDAVRLSDAEGPVAGAGRMGRFDCCAMLLLAGTSLAGPAEDLVRSIEQRPLSPDAPCMLAASRSGWGAIVRIAGISTEQVAHEVVQHLRFLRSILGVFPWDRKW